MKNSSIRQSNIYPSIESPIHLQKSNLVDFIMKTLTEKMLSNNDSIIIFNEQDLEIEENKKIILTSSAIFCVLFPMNKIIKEILFSYSVNNSYTNTKINIDNQIMMDFPRMKFNYNSKKCNSLYEFKTRLFKFRKYSHEIMLTLDNLIIMLCTQALFFYPFNVIHNIYTLPESNIYVMPIDDHPNINIIDNNTTVTIVIKKIFGYKNIDTDDIITKFHTFMTITIDLVEEPNGYLFYGKKYCKYNAGILYWINENNLLIV